MSDKHSYIYSRVSSMEQVNNTSLDAQILRCGQRAASVGGGPLGIYREEGETGTTDARPEWQKLLAECVAGRVQTIYALNWKRLARNARVGLQIAEELERIGVDLVVVEADFDTTTPTGRLMRHQMIGFAAFDRDSIVEQMALGQHAMAAKGLWPSGGASPYGYRATGGKQTNTLVLHVEEAETVRLMTAWIVDDGLTTGEVCRRLNAMGRLTRKGKEWSHSNLRRILRQRVILGEITWGGNEPETGRKYKSYVPKGYGPPKELRYEPILTEERWAALQVALDVRATGPKANRQPYALAGMLISPCDVNYGGVHRKDRDLRQYRCATRKWTAGSATRCAHPLLIADDIENRVWAALTDLLSDRERLLGLASEYLGLRAKQVGVETDERARLRSHIEHLERQQQDTLVDLLRRGIDAGLIEGASKALAADLVKARTRLAEVEAWAADSRTESERVTGIRQLAEMAQERLKSMSVAQRQKVFSILDVRVRVLDGSRTPALRIEGKICHESLIGELVPPGDPQVAGTPPAAPLRR